MDFKHFSHHHYLDFERMPPRSKLQCSGCRTTVSGNIYACWECNYFLHDQCYHAARSLKHPSHPSHPLTLVLIPTYQSGRFICDVCDCIGEGLSYGCSECEVDMHVQCALLPVINNLRLPIAAHPTPEMDTHVQRAPLEIDTHVQCLHLPDINKLQLQSDVCPSPTTIAAAETNSTPELSKSTSTIERHPHFSHPHQLEEVNPGKTCSACEGILLPSIYRCTETDCSYNLHKECFESPLELNHKPLHSHPLKLTNFPDPFTCHACLKKGNAFAYSCSTCSYNLHIKCAFSPAQTRRHDHDHELILYNSPASAFNHPNYSMMFICDACKEIVPEEAWVYYCRECDFGTHMECVYSEVQKYED